jgi:hypothetical protein
MFDDIDLTDETLDFDIEAIIKETQKATLVLIEGEEIWVPKSISVIDEKAMTISVPEWFAKRESLL